MSLLSLDNLPEKDLLRREKFAKQILTSLNSSFDPVNESMVIGICGSWGSGKTTLLKYLEKSIKEFDSNSDNYKIIHFNPHVLVGSLG